jgi:flagellar biosynthesis protein
MSRYMRQAVALAYGRHPVPVVTAKGDDDLAWRMIDEARKQGVFISEDPQLLALLSRLDVDQEIPQELYTAVAVVLSWVYWLKGMRPGDEKESAAEAPTYSPSEMAPQAPSEP